MSFLSFLSEMKKVKEIGDKVRGRKAKKRIKER